MSLDDRLRGALRREAAGFSPDPGDVTALVHGVRRRRRARRAKAGLGTTLVVALAALLVPQLGGERYATLTPGSDDQLVRPVDDCDPEVREALPAQPPPQTVPHVQPGGAVPRSAPDVEPPPEPSPPPVSPPTTPEPEGVDRAVTATPSPPSTTPRPASELTSRAQDGGPNRTPFARAVAGEGITVPRRANTSQGRVTLTLAHDPEAVCWSPGLGTFLGTREGDGHLVAGPRPDEVRLRDDEAVVVLEPEGLEGALEKQGAPWKYVVTEGGVNRPWELVAYETSQGLCMELRDAEDWAGRVVGCDFGVAEDHTFGALWGRGPWRDVDTEFVFGPVGEDPAELRIVLENVDRDLVVSWRDIVEMPATISTYSHAYVVRLPDRAQVEQVVALDDEETVIERREIAGPKTPAYGHPRTTPAPFSKGPHGVIGTVQARAQCGQEESPYPSSALEADLVVRSQGSSEVVVRAWTWENGRFRIALPPGHYVVEATPRGPGSCRPTEATVVRGEYSPVSIRCTI